MVDVETPLRNFYSLIVRSTIMAGATKKAAIQDANDAALQEFEAGLRRSIDQYKAGMFKSFKTKEEFLDHLKCLE